MQPDAPNEIKSTEGMVDYDDNSLAQRQLATLRAPLVARLASSVDPKGPELRIVDYGCGPGTTAVEAVRPAIAAWQQRFPGTAIAVCHADQVGNDWNALFRLATGPEGYGGAGRNVRIEAAVGSFYEPLALPGSVDLATCFFASHWLSRGVRLPAAGTVWFADLTGDSRTALAALARADWVRFLQCRALELRPDGRLLVSTLGAVPDDSEVNGAAVSGRGIYRALQTVANGMSDDGLIDRDVLDHFLFSLWFMTAAEAREPLEAEAALGECFEIEDIHVEPAPDHPSDLFAHAIDDRRRYAELYAGYTRAFADSTLRTQLLEPSLGDDGAVEQLAATFYDRLKRLYETTGNRYACEVWHLTVVLRRR
ncbi:MAG: hypothetical protein AAFX81_18160 [Pseudomonadota bacterium]